MTTPKYPHITVRLSGQNGNAFSLMGVTRQAMRKAKVPQDEIEEVMKECMAGDYDHLIQTIMRTVETE